MQRILDGRLKNLRQENARLRQDAELRQRAAVLQAAVQRQREEEQLRRAMDYAVARTRQQMAQTIASGGSRWRRTAAGGAASAVAIPGS